MWWGDEELGVCGGGDEAGVCGGEMRKQECVEGR